MAQSLKAAVVGSGFIGPVHVEGLRRLGIEVTGILGSSLDSGKRHVAEMRLPKAYGSLDELLSEPGLSAVHITTLNCLHAPMVKEAGAAGKHAIGEKPPAMSTAEGEELLALAEQAGIVHATKFNFRFYPRCKVSRERVRSGETGEITQIYGCYVQDWLLKETDWNWWLDPLPGGDMRAVADIGSHWLELTRFITGQNVSEVCADFATFVPIRKKPTRPLATFAGKELNPEDYELVTIKTEDYASILPRFDGGARGALTVSQVNAGRKNYNAFEICGAKSTLAWSSERVDELWIGHRDRANEMLLKDPSLMTPGGRSTAEAPGEHAEGFRSTFKQLYMRGERAIEAGGPPARADYPTFADGVYALKLGDAIKQSAGERRWVSVD